MESSNVMLPWLRRRLCEVLVPPLYATAQSIYRNTRLEVVQLNSNALNSNDPAVVRDVQTKLPQLVLRRFGEAALSYAGHPPAIDQMSVYVLQSAKSAMPEFGGAIEMYVCELTRNARFELGYRPPATLPPGVGMGMGSAAGAGAGPAEVDRVPVKVGEEIFCKSLLRSALMFFGEYPALMDDYLTPAVQMQQLQQARVHLVQKVADSLDLMVPLEYLVDVRRKTMSLPSLEQRAAADHQQLLQMTSDSVVLQGEAVQTLRHLASTLQAQQQQQQRQYEHRDGAYEESHRQLQEQLERRLQAERRQAQLDLEAVRSQHRSQSEQMARTIGELKRTSTDGAQAVATTSVALEMCRQEMTRLRADCARLQATNEMLTNRFGPNGPNNGLSGLSGPPGLLVPQQGADSGGGGGGGGGHRPGPQETGGASFPSQPSPALAPAPSVNSSPFVRSGAGSPGSLPLQSSGGSIYPSPSPALVPVPAPDGAYREDRHVSKYHSDERSSGGRDAEGRDDHLIHSPVDGRQNGRQNGEARSASPIQSSFPHGSPNPSEPAAQLSFGTPSNPEGEVRESRGGDDPISNSSSNSSSVSKENGHAIVEEEGHGSGSGSGSGVMLEETVHGAEPQDAAIPGTKEAPMEGTSHSYSQSSSADKRRSGRHGSVSSTDDRSVESRRSGNSHARPHRERRR